MFCVCYSKACYDFKAIESIQIEQSLLKNDENHDAQNNRSEHFFFAMNGYVSYVSTYNVDLTRAVSKYMSFLINKKAVNTRNLRPWLSKKSETLVVQEI